ncbi:MAG TPA: IclR family transcriptional regulator C-terminal domain-containing protein [Trebonia sp.]|jgi:DNA-binding IclR family transcriptional regulator
MTPPARQPAAGPRAVVPALDRGMRVLQLLADSPQRAYSLSEIAQLLAIPKSTAFNICGALAEGQLLRRVRDGFQLGRGLLELGSAYAASVNLVAEFYDVCREAPPDLGAVIQLAVLDEDLQAVYLAHQDCGSGLRLGLGGMVGRRVPANCTAGGKMLLALLPPAELDERLRRGAPLPRVTRRSVTSRARLLKEIAAARESGYAFDEDGVILGLSCVATGFPTSHADGGYLALSVTAPTSALDDTRHEQVRAALDAVAGKLRPRLLHPARAPSAARRRGLGLDRWRRCARGMWTGRGRSMTGSRWWHGTPRCPSLAPVNCCYGCWPAAYAAPTCT